MEKFTKAIEEYSRLISQNPKNAEAYYNRGVAKTMVGDRSGAYSDWKKAAELGHEKSKELTNGKR